MMFKTQIQGNPCYCRVDRYSPGALDKVSGSMEDAEEGYDEEFEFILLTTRRVHSYWLNQQITPADEARLLEEYHCTMLEQKHYWEES